MPDQGQLPSRIDAGPALNGFKGTFLYSPEVPVFSTQGALTTFIAAIDAITGDSVTGRGVLWIADPTNVAGTAALLGLSKDGAQTVGQLVAPIVPGTLTFALVGGAAASITGDTMEFASNGVVFFTGAAAPGAAQVSQVFTAALPLTGFRRGCILYDIAIQRNALFDCFSWGFHFFAPSDDPVYTQIGLWAPLAAGSKPNGADMIGFSASFDPSDPLNQRSNLDPGERPVRSVLVFTGANRDESQTLLSSGYATTSGTTVTLIPIPGPAPNAARLVFCNGELKPSQLTDFQAAPDGDFVLAVTGAAANQVYDLLCGLHGTEYLAFQPMVVGSYAGDRLSFTSRSPAFAPRYPFRSSSPVGPPSDPTAALLTDDYVTSWASLVPATSGRAVAYVAQPKGAPLYGRDALIHAADKTMLGAMDLSIVLPSGTAFPMIPYRLMSPGDGVNGFSVGEIEDFEACVIGPTRRALIGNSSGHAPSKAAVMGLVGATGESFNATTPTGLLVTVGPDGTWTKILLAQNLVPAEVQMCFCNPDANLQQALTTGQLFLVVANAADLGTLSGPGNGTCGTGQAFFNGINVGNWKFAADIGQNNRYGDYADVMIVKGRKGPLWDPNDPTGSLIANPEQWTMAQNFAAPSDIDAQGKVGAPQPAELVALSYWLQQYFQTAADQGDADYFGNFNTIATLHDWTGILFLRMTIAQLPDNLIGISAGVAAPERFNAHHFGIEISHVANDPEAPQIALTQSSSMFGLIYYVDPDFTPPQASTAPTPVPPSGNDIYGFRLLSLKALFQNTAIQRFQSTAQLTLGKLFGMPVDHMGEGGNPYSTLVLSGSYQDNGGKAVYRLGSATTSTFYFANNMFNKIEVDTAQMSTRDTGTPSGTVTSWFALSGFLDFAITKARDGNDFDLLSFGSPAGAGTTLRQGLAFSNLGLKMRFPVPAPGAQVTDIDFSFVTGELSFDVGTSTPRPGSICTDFALGLQGLVSGDGDAAPLAKGYLPVITDATLNDPSGGPWYGLSYQLNLGTPGALAGDVGFNASLLTAWSPNSAGTSSYSGQIGIKLPGAGSGGKLISLQNVLKLSIGQLRLIRSANSFLLMFTDIALRFLGLLKIPPSGSTLFYLFGNPDSGGKASGLGWYASYRKPQKQAEEKVRAALPERPEEANP